MSHISKVFFKKYDRCVDTFVSACMHVAHTYACGREIPLQEFSNHDFFRTAEFTLVFW